LADADGALKKRMSHLLSLTTHEGLDKRFAAVRRKLNGAAVAVDEVVRTNLLAVDQSEHQAVGDEGAELFNEVEREARTARAVCVEKADVGVQTRRHERGATIVCY
jgi:hypothetical protein